MTKFLTLLVIPVLLAGDSSPVTVVLTTPTDGSVVSNIVTLSVTVTSAVAPIARVEYYLDGNLIATVTNPITPPANLHHEN